MTSKIAPLFTLAAALMLNACTGPNDKQAAMDEQITDLKSNPQNIGSSDFVRNLAPGITCNKVAEPQYGDQGNTLIRDYFYNPEKADTNNAVTYILRTLIVPYEGHLGEIPTALMIMQQTAFGEYAVIGGANPAELVDLYLVQNLGVPRTVLNAIPPDTDASLSENVDRFNHAVFSTPLLHPETFQGYRDRLEQQNTFQPQFNAPNPANRGLSL